MKSSVSVHLPYLDGWRGLAIIAVLVAHFEDKMFAWMGAFGVQLFFVLSGFLMGGLLFVKEVPLKEFFIRRFTRILPAFSFFLTVVAIYSATLQPTQYTVPLDEFLSTLAFLRTYYPSDISIFAGHWATGHMWSLNVEEHSYIFLALGALIIRMSNHKNSAPAFLILSVACVLFVNLYYPIHHPDGASPWYLRSESAALGLLAAAAYRVTVLKTTFRWLRNPAPILPFIALIVAVFCYSTPSLKIFKYALAPLCLAYSINHLSQAPDYIRQVLSSKILCWFGTCSFSLYLWQQPFYWAHKNFGMPLLPMVLCALAFGATSFYCIENPLRLYLNNKWRSRNKSEFVSKNVPGDIEDAEHTLSR